METRSLLNRLEACVQEEIQARSRLLDLLERQERAIRGRSHAELESATRAIEREIQDDVGRALRRDEALKALERRWGVPARAMTLASVAERAGDGGERLLRLRLELRERTARVVAQNRRVAALLALHRRFVQDVIQALFQDPGETAVLAAPLSSTGTLVDAEA